MAGTPQPGAAAAPAMSAVAGAPTTASDLAALRAKRNEISKQLESAASRRQQLSASLIGKEGADRVGIEARISVLDKRIMQLETDLAETGQQLVAAPGALVATTAPANEFNGIDPDALAALGGVFTLFVLAPIAFAAARMMWKRATTKAIAPPQVAPEIGRRLERLEQGMDAIAVEIERVSEGQRFVTRLLSEQHEARALESLPRAEEPVRALADGSPVARAANR